MKLTAIVSAYNSSNFIGGCVDNLLEQTIYINGNLEIIVVNDKSTQKEYYDFDFNQSASGAAGSIVVESVKGNATVQVTTY